MHLKYIPSNENFATRPPLCVTLIVVCPRRRGPEFKRCLDHTRLTWCFWIATVAEKGMEACCFITRLGWLRLSSFRPYGAVVAALFWSTLAFGLYRYCPSSTPASLLVGITPGYSSRFFSSWEDRWSGHIAFPFSHLPGIHCKATTMGFVGFRCICSW